MSKKKKSINFIREKNKALIYVFSLALVLVFLIIGCMHYTEKESTVIPVRMHIEQGSFQKEITPFTDDEGHWYFCVPQNADPAVSYIYAMEPGLRLDGVEMTVNGAGLSISDMEYDREYAFSEDDDHSVDAKVILKETSRLPVIYLDTASGSMDAVYENKKHNEVVRITVFDQDGKLDYEGHAKDYINGRGNTTWGLSKKPFKITLAQSSGLLGMNPSVNWVLLANGYDKTNLRNKIVLDAARAAGSFFSPECVFADVYINGEYNGLYLLTEKAEMAENRVEPEDADRDLLFEAMQGGKIHQKDLQFRSADDRSFRLDYPKRASNERVHEIAAQVSELERDVKAGNYTKVDMDSWVRRVLTDEIFLNLDADVASSYYYYNAKQDKYYAGPIWDYDLCLGNNATDWDEYTKDPEKTAIMAGRWYQYLYANDTFKAALKKAYKDAYRAALIEARDKQIQEEAAKIRQSSEVNCIRWKKMFAEEMLNDEELDAEIDRLSAFLKTRIDYLDRIWIDGQSENFVEIDGEYQKMSLMEKLIYKITYDRKNLICLAVLAVFAMAMCVVGYADLKKSGVLRRKKRGC